jgi:hypothetical protein
VLLVIFLSGLEQGVFGKWCRQPLLFFTCKEIIFWNDKIIMDNRITHLKLDIIELHISFCEFGKLLDYLFEFKQQ